MQPGPFTLLMRETKIQTAPTMGNYGVQNQYRNERIIQHFYLAKPDKQIVPLRNPKKDLQNLFPKVKNQLTEFAKKEDLDFDDPIELARIVEFCNRSL